MVSNITPQPYVVVIALLGSGAGRDGAGSPSHGGKPSGPADTLNGHSLVKGEDEVRRCKLTSG